MAAKAAEINGAFPHEAADYLATMQSARESIEGGILILDKCRIQRCVDETKAVLAEAAAHAAAIAAAIAAAAAGDATALTETLASADCKVSGVVLEYADDYLEQVCALLPDVVTEGEKVEGIGRPELQGAVDAAHDVIEARRAEAERVAAVAAAIAAINVAVENVDTDALASALNVPISGITEACDQLTTPAPSHVTIR